MIVGAMRMCDEGFGYMISLTSRGNGLFCIIL